MFIKLRTIYFLLKWWYYFMCKSDLRRQYMSIYDAEYYNSALYPRKMVILLTYMYNPLPPKTNPQLIYAQQIILATMS